MWILKFIDSLFANEQFGSDLLLQTCTSTRSFGRQMNISVNCHYHTATTHYVYEKSQISIIDPREDQQNRSAVWIW
jgi:hypothetical protein